MLRTQMSVEATNNDDQGRTQIPLGSMPSVLMTCHSEYDGQSSLTPGPKRFQALDPTYINLPYGTPSIRRRSLSFLSSASHRHCQIALSATGIHQYPMFRRSRSPEVSRRELRPLRNSVLHPTPIGLSSSPTCIQCSRSPTQPKGKKMLY